jgi:hypothetical protein
MEELACFKINNDYLLLDIVLIHFNDIPLLFICKSRTGGTLYVALCEDIDHPEYLVIEPEVSDLKKMLNRSMTMRDVFLKQSHYYEIIPGENVESDHVSIRPGNEIPLDVLPIEGAFFEPVTYDLVEYLN